MNKVLTQSSAGKAAYEKLKKMLKDHLVSEDDERRGLDELIAAGGEMAAMADEANRVKSVSVTSAGSKRPWRSRG